MGWQYRRARVLMIFIVLIMIILVGNALFFIGYPYYGDFIEERLQVFFQNDFPDYPINKMVEPVYIMPYVGDIDGEVSEDWFFLYEKLVDFHEDNEIPVTFSFYPASIGDDYFDGVFLKMYESENIELMQKGYKGDMKEMEMYKLSYEEQKEIIKSGQDFYKKEMGRILRENKKTSYVNMPISYNQISGIVNNDTEQALIDLGFKMYFDMFVEGDYTPINSERDFYVTEYGVSFTVNGHAGSENRFKTPLEITNEMNSFNREDVDVLEINGVKVIPIWAHQQDFESREDENELDREKWNIYGFTMKKLSEDSNVMFLTPSKLYELKSSGGARLF